MNIGIIGYGYVGSAVAAAWSDRARVRFHDPAVQGSAPLSELVHDDVVFVCVPTPSRPDGRADLSAVQAVLGELAAARSSAVVVLKSTVPPGSTVALSERFPDLALAVAPEFLRERSAVADFLAPARLVLGFPPSTSAPARDRVRTLLHDRFPDTPLLELDATAAELVKYAANVFFATKVGLAAELAEVAGSLGVPWDEVRRGMALDPRIGDDHLRVPGDDGLPGFGGRCLPKDLAAWLALADDLGRDATVARAVHLANQKRRGAG
ncbi:MAG: UDP-glucose/GDP-mannose dehydrogenase family protein [Alphaproteobacteria bacterium]|nr:UDP-glucose/GDP-mannose dehydrogenase family protein [Alphaproteobacteria bacterium]MCB9697668.1 UDP-glucose/GDP-mannose dehydrogenase family protein [Alphaproteobacteria bacterium]